MQCTICWKGVQSDPSHLQQAFAAILCDGSVVTWGACWSLVVTVVPCMDELREYHSSSKPLAVPSLPFEATALSLPGVKLRMAVTVEMSRNQLKNVQQIQATVVAFAALLADASVVTWGNLRRYGGDSAAVQGTAEGCAADPSQ